ncbi:MAG: DUF115 domain-containing protein [Acidaminococcales bacterium]|nr:DUF115 domain-containing protein [Acidaminococcales bacterium]
MKRFNFKAELGKMTPKIAEGAKLYIWGTGNNCERISRMFARLVKADIYEYIDGFIDNDFDKQGTEFHGKRVYNISAIDPCSSVVLIAVDSHKANLDILKQLMRIGMRELNSVFPVDWAFNLLMKFAYSMSMQFKDKHKDKRCFVIANGSSLSVNDLNMLKNEITFAVNKIFLIFDKTDWRPTYYICQEDLLFESIQDEICREIHCDKFFSLPAVLELDEFKLTNSDYFYFQLDSSHRWRLDSKPGFSEDIALIRSGESVIYTCIQFAAYMGFSEIYLLGADNTMTPVVKLNGEIIRHNYDWLHFDSNYRPTDIYMPQIDVINAAYGTAREYADSHGIKIYNATRGGKLEAFERVNFDNLFEVEKCE